MIDIVGQLNAIRREVGERRIPAGEGRTVRLRREYDAPIEDVWDAITNAERINRWFLPVSGDLRLGGTYQLKGNAGGEIRRCEPPRLLVVTWVFGENPTEQDVTEVEVRLSPGAGGGTEFVLEHAAVVDPERWSTFGPGAVGVGWDSILLGLSLHLQSGGAPLEDSDAWAMSDEGRRFFTRSSEAWGEATKAAGGDPDEVAVMVANTTQAYAPDQPAD